MLLLSGTAAAGSVAPIPPDEGTPDPPSISELGTGEVSVNSVPSYTAIPGGCYGQTDRPHYSFHMPGTANVEARTVCSGSPVRLDLALYRDRWYGQQYLNGDGDNGYSTAAPNQGRQRVPRRDFPARPGHLARIQLNTACVVSLKGFTRTADTHTTRQ